MPMRKHTSLHRIPHLNYFNRMATSKDAIRSIEYNSTILAVFGSKSTGISPDRDVLVRFIAKGNTSMVIIDATGSTLNTIKATV
jgi:hypothetical protein